MKNRLSIWYEAIGDWLTRHLYIPPIVMGGVVLITFFYLFFIFGSAANDLNSTIQQIPKIIQSEMSKTRDVLKVEGATNRGVMADQHQATRDDLEKRMDQIDAERKQVAAELHKIETLTAPKQTVTKPPRKKVFGVF